VVVAGDRIVDVGPDVNVRSWTGPRTEIIDLAGKMVLPGFHDAHIHPVLGGLNMAELNLIGDASLPEYRHTLCEYARDHPERPFIRGYGWMHGSFFHSGPDRKDLDEIFPDRPAFLKAIDGHSAWVNSAALALAGISRETPDPLGGRIERDPETGEPTGTLREPAAMALVGDRLPPPTKEQMMAGLRLFLAEAARAGITSVHDAMGSREIVDVYAELEKRGQLTARAQVAITLDPASESDLIPELLRLSEEYRSDLVHVRTAKLFLDGVVDSHTAFLLEPYVDRPGFRGAPFWTPDQYNRIVAGLDAAGLHVHVHAIGDAAVRMALDGFERLAAANGRRDRRHQIAHLDMVSDSDIARFGQAGVIATMQPAWFYRDSNFFDSAMPFLGKSRATRLYRMRSLLESGAVVACSSDWPFGGDSITFSPLDSIQIGCTRQGITGDFREVDSPDEICSIASLIDGHTIHAAYANSMEHETGSLEPGKLADIAVLDLNLFEIPPEEIHQANVLLTLLAGRPVHRDPSF